MVSISNVKLIFVSNCLPTFDVHLSVNFVSLQFTDYLQNEALIIEVWGRQKDDNANGVPPSKRETSIVVKKVSKGLFRGILIISRKNSSFQKCDIGMWYKYVQSVLYIL